MTGTDSVSGHHRLLRRATTSRRYVSPYIAAWGVDRLEWLFMGRPLKLESAPFAQLCVHLPPELVRDTKLLAIARGVTLQRIVRRALTRYLVAARGEGRGT